MYVILTLVYLQRAISDKQLLSQLCLEKDDDTPTTGEKAPAHNLLNIRNSYQGNSMIF